MDKKLKILLVIVAVLAAAAGVLTFLPRTGSKQQNQNQQTQSKSKATYFDDIVAKNNSSDYTIEGQLIGREGKNLVMLAPIVRQKGDGTELSQEERKILITDSTKLLKFTGTGTNTKPKTIKVEDFPDKVTLTVVTSDDFVNNQEINATQVSYAQTLK